MFNENDPPTTYKDFRKQVLKTVSEAEIDCDDDYETAVFMVNRDNEGKIVYAQDIYEDTDGELSPETILYMILPHHIRTFNSKFYAVVLPTEVYLGGKEEEFVLLLVGDLDNTELLKAPIEVNHNMLELLPWEQIDLEDFDDLVIPFRRSIVLQG